MKCHIHVRIQRGETGLLEAEFLIAICRPAGDKWQSKTLFLVIFDVHSSIDKSVFHCHLSGVLLILLMSKPQNILLMHLGLNILLMRLRLNQLLMH